MIGEAAAFADKAHKGAFRKGTKIPYITHPMETAVIVSAFTDDEESLRQRCFMMLWKMQELPGKNWRTRLVPE